MNRYTAPLAAIVLFAGAAEAQAATIVYFGDRSGFGEANASLQLEDFSDAVLTPGLSLTGTNFSISAGRLAHRVATGFNMTAHFAAPVYAFGFDYDLSVAGIGQGLALMLTFSDGSTQRIDDVTPSPTKGFYGFQSNRQVTGVSFGARNGTESYAMDNFTFGGVAPPSSAVPEPATWAMMIAGFGLAGAGLRQRRRAALIAWS